MGGIGSLTYVERRNRVELGADRETGDALCICVEYMMPFRLLYALKCDSIHKPMVLGR